VDVVTFDQWKTIDHEEVMRGKVVGKPREKITSIEEMLQTRNNSKRDR